MLDSFVLSLDHHRHFRVRGIVVVGLALVLAACQGDIADLAITAPSLPLSYASSTAIPARPQRDIGDWWQVFHDPVLSSLITRSAEQNLSIAQAKQRLAAGRSQAGVAGGLFQPNTDLGGTASAGSSRTKSDELFRRPVQLNLEASWELGFFGLRENTLRSAKASLDMLSEEAEVVRITVAAEIASAYVRLRALQEREAITLALTALLDRNRQLAKTKHDAGLATNAEVEALNISSDDAAADRARIRAQIAGTCQQIATMSGTATVDQSLLRAVPQPVAALDPVIGRPADLLRARPDLRRAELAVIRAAADIGIAQADLFPKLRLAGMLGVGAPSNGALFGIVGGPSVQIPLIDQGRRRAVVAARKAQFDEAVAAYKSSVISAYEEASSALRAWSAEHANARRLTAALRSSKKISGEIRILQREGLSDGSRQNAAAIDTLLRRKQLADAKEAEALVLVAFYKAIGGASPLTTNLRNKIPSRHARQ